jgi:hypothetical protein
MGKKLTAPDAMNLNPDVVKSPAQIEEEAAAQLAKELEAAKARGGKYDTSEKGDEAYYMDKARRDVKSINLKRKR